MATKKTPPRSKAAAKKSDAFEFIVSALKRNPNASFADIRDRAAKKKLTIFPVSYGRAKLLLGLVKAKPKKARAAKRGPGRPRAAKRPVGRPRKASAVNGSVQDIVAQIGEMQKDRDRLRRTLGKIREMLDAVV